jgi:hypothetical protein
VEAFQVGNAPPLPWQPEGAEAVPVHQLVWQGMAPAIVGVDVWLRAELSGDMALEASFDVADGLALGEATLHVLLCGAVLTHADQHDGVERAVELSISRPVRCRVMVPDDASMGAAPPSLAKAASERMRRCATRR